MRALLILLPALLLAACGQKGALYQPSQAPVKRHWGGSAPTDSAPAPTSTTSAPAAGASSGTP